MKRRDLLILGPVIAAAIALPPVLRRWPRSFEFGPLPGFDGFRRLASGPSGTSGFSVFAGLDAEEDTAQPPVLPKNPCPLLFHGARRPQETVPIAVFSDFSCPYCSELERQILDMRDAGAPVTLHWHEYPLLGPTSVRAARAALAAAEQGAADEAHVYLMRRHLRPGPGALREMARELALDPERLISDEKSKKVSDKLALSMALGRAFGIPGTPGMVVGRTLVIGAISLNDLERLVALELDAPDAVCQ